MFFKSLKTRLKKGRGSGKKELHLQSFGNLSTCKSLTYNMCVHHAHCPGWGRMWPVSISVYSGDNGSASKVSSQEPGQHGASELEWGLSRGSASREWGTAGWTPSCRLSAITAARTARMPLLQMLSHARGRPLKPRSTCVLPLWRLGGKALVGNLHFHVNLQVFHPIP